MSARATSLSSLFTQLDELAASGYIPTHRTGDTGIGKTLEDVLGIDENNRAGADHLGVELKSTRRESTASITLFTKSPPESDRALWGRDLIESVGYTDDKDRTALKCSITPTPNAQGLFLDVAEEGVHIEHESLGNIATYPFEIVVEKLQEKLATVVLVEADVKRKTDGEQFWYRTGWLLSAPSLVKVRALLESGDLSVEFRRHLTEDGSERNRGTAWRVTDVEAFKSLYASAIQLYDYGNVGVQSSPRVSVELPQSATQNRVTRLDEFV